MDIDTLFHAHSLILHYTLDSLLKKEMLLHGAQRSQSLGALCRKLGGDYV